MDFVDVGPVGALEVGTESNPLTNRAAIRLTGERAGSFAYDQSGNTPGSGQPLSLRLFEGRLDLHGTPPVPTWTRARVTFTAGETQLELEDEVDWPAGATIVVASTDFDPAQTETRPILANDTVAGSGTGTLRVDPLDHLHFGDRAGPYGGMTVDMCAEVAVLERSVHPQPNLPPTFVDPVTGADLGRAGGERTPLCPVAVHELDHGARPVPPFRPVRTLRKRGQDHALAGYRPGAVRNEPPRRARREHGEPTALRAGLPARPRAERLADAASTRSGTPGQRMMLSLPLAAAPAANEVRVDGAVATQVTNPAALGPDRWLYQGTTLTLMLAINPGTEPAPLDGRETVVRIR